MGRHIYLVGSLSDPAIPQVAQALRGEGHLVFDDWYAAGPKADEHWQEYEKARGRTYLEALGAPGAEHNLKFDKEWLDWADTAVLVLPCGRSPHYEAGYVQGKGDQVHILCPFEPEKWTLMYGLATGVHRTVAELLEAVSR